MYLLSYHLVCLLLVTCLLNSFNPLVKTVLASLQQGPSRIVVLS